jgi:hypothetical protein
MGETMPSDIETEQSHITIYLYFEKEVIYHDFD